MCVYVYVFECVCEGGNDALCSMSKCDDEDGREQMKALLRATKKAKKR